MFDYVAVDVPSVNWTNTQEAWWLVMESTTSGLVHITHIQFLTLLYPSGIEARLIFLLLGPLAIASSGMVFTSMNSDPEVRDLGDAVRNVCNSALSLLFTAALLAWGFVIHRTPAWRTDGGTAAFGIGAITLAVLSTISNFVQIFLSRRIHWLLSLTWAVVLWQSFLGWWWWVGSGEGINEVEDMLERERRRRRKRAKKKRKEAQATAADVDPHRNLLRVLRRRGPRPARANDGDGVAHAGSSSNQEISSSHPEGSSHPENTLSNPETHSHTTSSHTSTAPSNALSRAWTRLRHAHRRATTVQAIEQVELRNATPGWGLGSFGVMEAERRRAGREVERREGERRLVETDRDEEGTVNETGDGRDVDTDDVRSGGESDAENSRRRHTAYPPLGWTQRDLDQQADALRSRRSEREMRRKGDQLSGDEDDREGLGGTWGWGPLRRWRLKDSTSYSKVDSAESIIMITIDLFSLYGRAVVPLVTPGLQHGHVSPQVRRACARAEYGVGKRSTTAPGLTQSYERLPHAGAFLRLLLAMEKRLRVDHPSNHELKLNPRGSRFCVLPATTRNKITIEFRSKYSMTGIGVLSSPELHLTFGTLCLVATFYTLTITSWPRITTAIRTLLGVLACFVFCYCTFHPYDTSTRGTDTAIGTIGLYGILRAIEGCFVDLVLGIHSPPRWVVDGDVLPLPTTIRGRFAYAIDYLLSLQGTSMFKDTTWDWIFPFTKQHLPSPDASKWGFVWSSLWSLFRQYLLYDAFDLLNKSRIWDTRLLYPITNGGLNTFEQLVFAFSICATTLLGMSIAATFVSLFGVAFGSPVEAWPPLFYKPLNAVSVADFWARWHPIFRRPFDRISLGILNVPEAVHVPLPTPLCKAH
ncbi:Transmembrane protein [Ceratobasidium theobromae]|uniref:Transmembrane protein n=1 Tax=Ceratobasidium theobromae TaxID=1582974 RepID=A0A5N5QJK1_9AGAM|nr:Transmembrane protein [Ceratobasidium theobromae]